MNAETSDRGVRGRHVPRSAQHRGRGLSITPLTVCRKGTKNLEELTKQATSETPSKRWYEFSADGLLEAAKTVAEMAAPVTTAVKAVLALLI